MLTENVLHHVVSPDGINEGGDDLARRLSRFRREYRVAKCASDGHIPTRCVLRAFVGKFVLEDEVIDTLRLQ